MPVYTGEVYEIVGFPEIDESILWQVKPGPIVVDGVAFYVANITTDGVIANVASAADSLGASDTASRYFYTSRTALDSLTVPEVVSTFASYRPTVADVIGILDPNSLGFVRTISESLEIDPAMVVTRGLTVVERLGVTPSVLTRMMHKMTVAEVIGFIDGLFNFFALDIIESLSMVDDEVVNRFAPATALDTVSVDESVERILVLRVTAPESINIDDASLTQMFFDAKLADLLDIAAMYVAPNDSFTVWNVNAVTGSVSRYENYAFNSFARFGQMYIGADESGLYELNGCNDEGKAIVARIKSGLAQLTASRFTMVRDAYMGIRSDGTFILRVTTGEGHTYDYKFDAENMKTTRVPLGKGMRTRYMSFELISAGSDFDLESVEFIPLMSSRRV